MKKFSSIMLLAAGVFAFSACSSNDDIVEQNGQKTAKGEVITLTASYGTDSRVALGADDVSLSWEDGDILRVWTAKKGDKNISSFRLSSGAGTTTGQFTGTLMYDEETTLDASTELYAVVGQELDINGDMIISRLGTQTGTKTDAMGHMVLYGKTTYGAKSFAFENKLDLLKLSVNVDGVKNQTVTIKLRGEGVASRVVYDPATGESSATPGEITISNVEIDNKGNADLYVALYPGSYTNLEASVTYNAGGTEYYAPARVFNGTKELAAGQKYTAFVGFSKPVQPAKVGWFLNADGTWTEAPASNSVALIVSTEVSATDFRAGYTHGYAIALKGLKNGYNYQWSNDANDNPAVLDNTKIRSILDMMSDMDGRTGTEKLYAALSGKTPAEGLEFAAVAVKSFTADKALGASDWFLPSTGQAYKMFQNFYSGELTTENDIHTEFDILKDHPTWIPQTAVWNNIGPTLLATVNDKLTGAKTLLGDENVELFTEDKGQHWCCNEKKNQDNTYRGGIFGFNMNTGYIVDDQRYPVTNGTGFGGVTRSQGHRVRPFIAF